MKNLTKGFTLVEIMIVVMIISLLAAIAIPNLLRARVSANETAAQTALKSISTALENYMITFNSYPPDTATLIGGTPPFLNTDFFTGVHNGYTFVANLTNYTYNIIAFPQNSNTGNYSFTISTGAVLTQE